MRREILAVIATIGLTACGPSKPPLPKPLFDEIVQLCGLTDTRYLLRSGMFSTNAVTVDFSHEKDRYGARTCFNGKMHDAIQILWNGEIPPDVKGFGWDETA